MILKLEEEMRHGTIMKKVLHFLMLGTAVLFVPLSSAIAQAPGSHPLAGCTVNALNRQAQVNPNGLFILNNIPVAPGPFRIRAICERENGVVETGESPLVQGVGNGQTSIETISYPVDDMIPVFLFIA